MVQVRGLTQKLNTLKGAVIIWMVGPKPSKT
jgi:hypothetical protein